jgi:hypothetical protein
LFFCFDTGELLMKTLYLLLVVLCVSGASLKAGAGGVSKPTELISDDKEQAQQKLLSSAALKDSSKSYARLAERAQRARHAKDGVILKTPVAKRARKG